jgi:selenide,water dikinase
MFSSAEQSHKSRAHGHLIPYTIFFIMTILQPARVSVVQSLAVTTNTKPVDRVVLVGGGHAHAQVLKALNGKSRPKNMHVTLIDMLTAASYSGMVPGCVARLYKPEDTLLHLTPLAKWADIDFVQDEVVDMDVENNLLYLKNSQEPIPFDVISLDIGSATRGVDETPGARKYTIPTRPISDLVRRIDQAEQELGETAHVVVVGGGAAGVELSMSIMGRWEPVLAQGCLKVTLLDGGSQLLPNESPACQDALNEIMKKRGIYVRHNCQVQEITDEVIHLRDGEKLPYTHCIWATGAGSHPLAETLRKRGLAVNDRGWIRVTEHLQSLSHPRVFAAGDCSSMETGTGQQPPPKAGVYAVRAGPVLIENLVNFLAHDKLTDYAPQDDFLKLIVCGDGTALGFHFGIPIYGKWVMQLKDAIDQMFMNLFRRENLMNLDEGASYDTTQYDAALEMKPWSRLDPEKAAALLQQTDDDVDYEQAWHVLREITKDEAYRTSVLECVENVMQIVR